MHDSPGAHTGPGHLTWRTTIKMQMAVAKSICLTSNYQCFLSNLALFVVTL